MRVYGFYSCVFDPFMCVDVFYMMFKSLCVMFYDLCMSLNEFNMMYNVLFAPLFLSGDQRTWLHMKTPTRLKHPGTIQGDNPDLCRKCSLPTSPKHDEDRCL